MANYSRSQLEALWVQAGGNSANARMAAAIALAESGGNPNAVNDKNTNGSIDRGLWQINSVHGALSVLDPLANARAAVQISKNGSDWHPWCTAWSNGRCGGTFMGAGSPVLKFLTGDASTPDSSMNVPLQNAGFELTNPRAWAEAFLKPIGVWLWYQMMEALGLVFFLLGVYLLIRETRAGEAVRAGGRSLLNKATYGVMGRGKGSESDAT